MSRDKARDYCFTVAKMLFRSVLIDSDMFFLWMRCEAKQEVWFFFGETTTTSAMRRKINCSHVMCQHPFFGSRCYERIFDVGFSNNQSLSQSTRGMMNANRMRRSSSQKKKEMKLSKLSLFETLVVNATQSQPHKSWRRLMPAANFSQTTGRHIDIRSFIPCHFILHLTHCRYLLCCLGCGLGQDRIGSSETRAEWTQRSIHPSKIQNNQASKQKR